MKIVGESLTLMSASFGLVAALAWNEAIKALIDEVIPKGQGLLSLFVYAILVTIVAIIVTSRLVRLKKRLEEDKQK